VTSPIPHSRRRENDVQRIVVSIAVSALGTWSYNVGIAVYAYEQTQSTAWVAIATVGRYIPAVLITLVGSRVADRYPKRAVAVSTDLLCAATMALLTVVALTQGSLVVAILLAALSSGLARVQSSAALSVAADIVTESRLARTANLISSAEAVATAVGPAIASLVLAVSSPAVLFALNGVTFLASAGLLIRTSAPDVVSLRPRPGSWTVEGVDETYRAAVRLVRPLLVTRTIAALVYGMDIVLLAVIATERLRDGTSGYGWLLAGAGAGGLLAAGLMRRQDRPRPTALVTSIGLVLYAVPSLVFLASPGLGGSLAVQVVRGFGCVLLTATALAGLQRGVPAAVAGRVFGLNHVLVLVGTSVGAVLAPVLIGVLGLNVTLVLVGVVPLLLQVAALPGLLHFDRRGSADLQALDPRVDLLRRLALFRDANRSTLYGVADRADEVKVPSGVVVIAEGEEAQHLFVLVSGSVEVTIGHGDETRTVRAMSAPSYFGEIGLLHGIARTATVTTAEDCTVWSIPADAFLAAATQAGLSSALTDTAATRFAPALASARSALDES
jgi:MFS family permease